MIPAASGLYFVFSCYFDSYKNLVTLRKLLYVGKSENVNYRLLSHEKELLWRQSLQVGELLCFSYAAVLISELDRVEAAMIYHYQPLCNVDLRFEFPYDTTQVFQTGVLGVVNFLVTGHARR